MRRTAAALALLLVCNTAFAGQTRRYYTRPLPRNIIYFVPLFPTPAISRGIGPGINTPPNNSTYFPSLRMSTKSPCRQSPTFAPLSPVGTSGPQLIINPYYKGDSQ